MRTTLLNFSRRLAQSAVKLPGSFRKEKRMKFGEIVKLTTAGYKPADIRELDEITKETPDALSLALNGSSLADVKELITLASGEEANAEPEKPEQPEGAAEPDYKKLYEELKEKSDTLERTIKDIQSNNQRQDQSGNIKSEEEQVAEIIRSFM